MGMDLFSWPDSLTSILLTIVLVAVMGELLVLFIFNEFRCRRAAAAHAPGSGDLRLPPAAETARSVARFHEAAARYFLLEFVWDRCAQGRLLFSRPRRGGRRP